VFLHIQPEVSREQDEVTGKLPEVSLHHEGVRPSIHLDSQTHFPEQSTQFIISRAGTSLAALLPTSDGHHPAAAREENIVFFATF
jgi:hypothetical protein